MPLLGPFDRSPASRLPRPSALPTPVCRRLFDGTASRQPTVLSPFHEASTRGRADKRRCDLRSVCPSKPPSRPPLCLLSSTSSSSSSERNEEQDLRRYRHCRSRLTSADPDALRLNQPLRCGSVQVFSSAARHGETIGQFVLRLL